MNENEFKGMLMLLDIEKNQHSEKFLLNIIEKHIKLFNFNEEQLKTLEKKKQEIKKYKRTFKSVKDRIVTKKVIHDINKLKKL